MKVAVGPGQAVGSVPQPPARGHRRPLDLLTGLGRQQRIGMRVAVEDAHQAFAVADQLPDAPMVECGLVALCCVDIGQETCESLGPRDVEVPQRGLEQSFEIMPVQRTLHLLHELKELGRLRHRHQLSRFANNAHVQTPGVAWKAVVGRVTIERLPGAVRRVVVAEPLRRACARHDERPGDAADGALDLERDTVAETLGIVRLAVLGLERPQGENLDAEIEDVRQIPRESLAVDPGEGRGVEPHHDGPTRRSLRRSRRPEPLPVEAGRARRCRERARSVSACRATPTRRPSRKSSDRHRRDRGWS